MPELIHDTVQYLGGNKNASVGGGWSFTGEGIPSKNLSETYLIRGDSEVDDEDYILGTAGLPILGQPIRNGWCVNRTARCVDDSAKLWEVTCQCKGDVSVRVKDSTYEKDPDNFPGVYWPRRLDEIAAVLNWSTETIQEPLLRDTKVMDKDAYFLKKVTNTVGEPLFPPVERSLFVLEADYYMVDDDRIYSYNMLEEFVNKTNDDTFMGAPPGCVLCTGIEMEPTGLLPYYEGLMPEDPANAPDLYPPNFHHIRAQFKFRFWYTYSCVYKYLMPDPAIPGWILKLLNVGNTMKKKKRPDQPSNTETEHVGAAAIDKAPVRANLDMDGFPLDPTEDPIWLEFNRYQETDFDALVDPSILPTDIHTIAPVQGPAPCL